MYYAHKHTHEGAATHVFTHTALHTTGVTHTREGVHRNARFTLEDTCSYTHTDIFSVESPENDTGS